MDDIVKFNPHDVHVNYQGKLIGTLFPNATFQLYFGFELFSRSYIYSFEDAVNLYGNTIEQHTFATHYMCKDFRDMKPDENQLRQGYIGTAVLFRIVESLYADAKMQLGAWSKSGVLSFMPGFGAYNRRGGIIFDERRGTFYSESTVEYPVFSVSESRRKKTDIAMIADLLRKEFTVEIGVIRESSVSMVESFLQGRMSQSST